MSDVPTTVLGRIVPQDSFVHTVANLLRDQAELPPRRCWRIRASERRLRPLRLLHASAGGGMEARSASRPLFRTYRQRQEAAPEGGPHFAFLFGHLRLGLSLQAPKWIKQLV